MLVTASTSSLSLSVVAAVYIFDKHSSHSTQTEKRAYRRSIIGVMVSIVVFWLSIFVSINGIFGVITPGLDIISSTAFSALFLFIGISILGGVVAYLSVVTLKWE